MLSRCYTGGKERATEGGCTAAAPCYALAASSPALTGFTHLTSFARAKRSKSHAAATPFACATWVPVSPRGALPRGALVAGGGGRGAGDCRRGVGPRGERRAAQRGGGGAGGGLRALCRVGGLPRVSRAGARRVGGFASRPGGAGGAGRPGAPGVRSPTHVHARQPDDCRRLERRRAHGDGAWPWESARAAAGDPCHRSRPAASVPGGVSGGAMAGPRSGVGSPD